MKLGMLVKAYLGIGAVLIGGYAGTALFGKEYGNPVMKKQAPSTSHSSGRSHGPRGFFYGGGGGK